MTDHYSSGGTVGGRSFLQRRVAYFGLAAGGILFFGLVCRAVAAVVLGDYTQFGEPSFFFHFLGSVVFLSLWAFCTGPPRSRKFVRRFEAVGLVVGCAAIQGMGIYIPHARHPEMIVTIALTQGLLARAIFVPSSPRRTLGLSAIIGVGLVASVYITWTNVDPLYKFAARGAWGFGGGDMAVGMALTTLFWWIVTMTVCTAASHVVYGLRAKVQQAQQLGQYTLQEKLGEGSMGMVFRAQHGMLRRPTAIKLLLPDKVGEQHLARFEREVQLTARLTHPHTVTIFDYGRTPDGIFYYAMELLEGASLDKVVEVDGAQPPERVAYLMDQVAAALGEAHSVGLIHRDIKPANIILTQQGGEPDVAKVVDFGLVKDIQGEHSPELSLAGEGIAGTPLYMPPETITAYQQVDARSDIYSLGAVCYYLLTGTNVFEADTAANVCTKHLYEEPEPPSKRLGKEVPHDLEALILACLEKEPGKRPQSAQHIRARLWAGGTLNKWNTDRARRWWRARGDAVRDAGKVGREKIDGVARTIAVDLDKLRLD